MSFCQLRLATKRPKYVLKNGSSKRGTRESAIHYQLDVASTYEESSDARKRHGFCNFFRLAETALWNDSKERTSDHLGGISVEIEARGRRLQIAVSIAPVRRTFHANVARCQVGRRWKRAIETRQHLLLAGSAATRGRPR